MSELLCPLFIAVLFAVHFLNDRNVRLENAIGYVIFYEEIKERAPLELARYARRALRLPDALIS